MNVAGAIARRRSERAAMIASVRDWALGLPQPLGVHAVVVFGSVARGDFNLWSDIDVLVVADGLPERPLDRLDALAPWPANVQPVAWTRQEWHAQLRRRNPIAVESRDRGVWLRGDAAALA